MFTITNAKVETLIQGKLSLSENFVLPINEERRFMQVSITAIHALVMSLRHAQTKEAHWARFDGALKEAIRASGTSSIAFMSGGRTQEIKAFFDSVIDACTAHQELPKPMKLSFIALARRVGNSNEDAKVVVDTVIKVVCAPLMGDFDASEFTRMTARDMYSHLSKKLAEINLDLSAICNGLNIELNQM